MGKGILIVIGSLAVGAIYAIKMFLEKYALFDLAVVGFVIVSIIGLLLLTIYARNQNE